MILLATIPVMDEAAESWNTELDSALSFQSCNVIPTTGLDAMKKPKEGDEVGTADGEDEGCWEGTHEGELVEDGRAVGS